MRGHSVFEAIGGYYDSLVERYGHDPKAADYGHPASQERKFEVLADAVKREDRSLLDVGCGFADFYSYLDKQGLDLDYRGIDLSANMIVEAARFHPDASLSTENVLELPDDQTYDVVVANGIFYLLGEDAVSLMHEIISKMFALANRLVAFNSLSSWAPDPEEGEFYADPSAVLASCSRLTKRIVLRHDYHPRDFTLYLYK